MTKITSDIGEFSHLIDCHGVCGNNNVVSFVTNLLVESVFGKKMQFFMCLVVSSSRLLFIFHVFSFKWVLISILIWNGSWTIKTEKNLRSVLATEHAKLGLFKNCLNSIMRWLANVTIFLLFTWTFETWYSCFFHKAKGILHDPYVFWYLRAMCSGNKWYKVKYLGNNGKRAIFFKALIIISRINKN